MCQFDCNGTFLASEPQARTHGPFYTNHLATQVTPLGLTLILMEPVASPTISFYISTNIWIVVCHRNLEEIICVTAISVIFIL